MRFCPHCMNWGEGDTCPYCGGSLDYQNPVHLLPVGTEFTGGGGRQYMLGASLGQGGFGVTYAGVEPETGRRIAVKEYFPTRSARRGEKGQVEPLAGQEAAYEKGRFAFVQEARMLSNLEGMPSVVQGLDYLEEYNTAYLVMEFLDGTPLYRMVAKQGSIPPAELLPRLRPLMQDLGALHHAGVIHRDISPDNVMWMQDGALKILDFGCARSMDEGKSMTVALKQGFAPVEQYQTHGQGPWTDVYALCATVYYCLTGNVPPSAPDRLLDDNLVPPSKLNVPLEAAEEKALLWGLAVPPRQRPVDMPALAQALFPQQPVDYTPPKPGLWQRFARWFQEHLA